METKSRYEVIAELEEKKRKLIIEKESSKDVLAAFAREIKTLNRQLEDKEEELDLFESTVEDRKETIGELIKSIDDSLKRLSNLQSQKK